MIRLNSTREQAELTFRYGTGPMEKLTGYVLLNEVEEGNAIFNDEDPDQEKPEEEEGEENQQMPERNVPTTTQEPPKQATTQKTTGGTH